MKKAKYATPDVSVVKLEQSSVLTASTEQTTWEKDIDKFDMFNQMN